jgi:hypothetical protein
MKDGPHFPPWVAQVRKSLCGRRAFEPMPALLDVGAHKIVFEDARVQVKGLIEQAMIYLGLRCHNGYLSLRRRTNKFTARN